MIDHGPWGGEEVIVHRVEEERRRSSESSEDADWQRMKNAHIQQAPPVA